MYTTIYIPVLDDPISPVEVDTCVRRLKPNKAAGVDGISPSILRTLPDEWIVLLTRVFNMAFTSRYPLAWSLMKIFSIYKKGHRLDPQNYRGISIISAIPKLYDMVLSDRFSLWYQPRPEQAGSQKNRGCEELILSLRLLLDIARKKKRTLYITYVDYQKAYDRVNRRTLLEHLEQLGCGTTFLLALKNSMSAIGLIGKDTFETSNGVKQGGSSSCKLFTSYVDPTIDAVNSFGQDDWLGNTHIMLLMDDTVVLATSRQAMERKLFLLKQKADDIGMLFHPTKCQYMSINDPDTTPITLGDVTICRTSSYTYLGAIISDCTVSQQVKNHVNAKKSHSRKYTSFLAKNSDAPYSIKHKVLTAAINAALFYSCETWLTSDLRAVESMYMRCIKQMLSVRTSTCHDLVHIDTGLPNAKSIIVDRQVKFLLKMRTFHNNDFITRIIDLAITAKTPMGNRIHTLETQVHSRKDNFFTDLRQSLRNSQSTRRQDYTMMNPELNISPVLDPKCDNFIPEMNRISVNRLRLGSHHLKIETGRWARIPRDERLCVCGGDIQSESHVLIDCPRSEHLRHNMNIHPQSLYELFKHKNTYLISEYCNRILFINWT